MQEGKEPLWNYVRRFFKMQKKGVSSEFLESELPAPFSQALLAARETILLFLLFFFAFPSLFFPVPLLIFLSGWLLWKTIFSTYTGWEKLERLHRIIEKEEWEITHRRPQERKELLHIYEAKGLKGKLLDEVVDVLMANDNRLLQVMIEEEMGIVLESYDHPLKLGLGAFVGTFLSSLVLLFSLFFFSSMGLFVVSFLLIGYLAGTSAHFAKNKIVPAIIWHEGICLLTISIIFFLKQWIS